MDNQQPEEFPKVNVENLDKHDAGQYKVLLHTTPTANKEAIRQEGLKVNYPPQKSLYPTGLLYLSYPIANTTGDLFRFYPDWSIVVIDVQKCLEKGIQFYDDPHAGVDQSSRNNHLCTDSEIPADCISQIIDYADTLPPEGELIDPNTLKTSNLKGKNVCIVNSKSGELLLEVEIKEMEEMIDISKLPAAEYSLGYEAYGKIHTFFTFEKS